MKEKIFFAMVQQPLVGPHYRA